ncbi:MAG: hypothetical protein GY702_13580 [Desulfobulbaceae bacterium]|nr:hypothetical protein [Desulfobulbaceae bacterium]
MPPPVQIAIGKYGKKLKVEGDAIFVEKIIRVAKSEKLNVIINNQKIAGKGHQKGRGAGR